MSAKKTPVFTANYAIYGGNNVEQVTDQHRAAMDTLQEFIGKYERGQVIEFSFAKKEQEFIFKSSYTSDKPSVIIIRALKEVEFLLQSSPEIRGIDNFGLKGGDTIGNAIDKVIKTIETL